MARARAQEEAGMDTDRNGKDRGVTRRELLVGTGVAVAAVAAAPLLAACQQASPPTATKSGPTAATP